MRLSGTATINAETMGTRLFMRLFKTAALTALTLSCAFITLDAPPAQATTLMDLLFKKERRAPREFDAADPRFDAPVEEKRVYKPVARVTGPRYYTYKVDPLKRVVLEKTASDPVTTGSVGSGGLAPATLSAAEEMRQQLNIVDVRASAEVAKAIAAYYNAGKRFIWVDENGLTDNATEAMAVLSNAAKVGLDPEDYAVALPPVSLDSADPDARLRALAQFEVALSAASLDYVSDTIRGRVDPNRISGYHDFKRKTVNLSGVLSVLSLSSDAGAYLRSRSPSSRHFVALQKELERLKAKTDEAPRIEIAEGTLLKPGRSSPETANVVAAIRLKGSDALKMEHSLTLAGYTGGEEYTPELVALVEAFQKEKGLKPDGVVGPASIRVLTGGDTTADKIAKVVVAMERARWIATDLGPRHVFINQPAFEVYYYEEGAEKLSMRTVVGSKSNQTYFFEDKIETVEFNPYWGVPQSIIINEMLPKLHRDPSYLDRMGYEVTVNGRKVSSSAVDWSSPRSVAVRQPPSSDNALGDLKILFPNSHAIYMHDTPSKSFFQRDQRALSHGCVRLSDPRAMAAAVLGTTVDDVSRQIADGRNKGVEVKADIPVYVAYFTAWPNKDGVVEYFEDVYGRDAYVERAFKATSDARHADS